MTRFLARPSTRYAAAVVLSLLFAVKNAAHAQEPTPATPTPATPTPATPTPATPAPATPTPATPAPATPTPATPTPDPVNSGVIIEATPATELPPSGNVIPSLEGSTSSLPSAWVGSSAPRTVPSAIYPSYFAAGYVYPVVQPPSAVYFSNYYVPMSSVAYPVYAWPASFNAVPVGGVVYGAPFPFEYVNPGAGGTWPPTAYTGPVILGW